MDKVTKRIKPKWQLEKEQSKRGAFDSINDFANYWANQFQEGFSEFGKSFHSGVNKAKSKDGVGIVTANTTTLFKDRNDEIRKKTDQLSKRLDELERKIKEF